MASASGGATTDADSRRGRPPGSNRGHSTRSARALARPRIAPASGVDDRSAPFVRRCAPMTGSALDPPRPRRWSRRSSRARGASAGPVAAHGPVPTDPPTPASLLLGWTFEPLPTLGILVVVGWWWWAVRRVNTVHPANPVPRRRIRRVPRRDAGARLRAAVGDRALRHDALLGPHGPARAADAGRGAARSRWPRRSRCSCA